MISEPPLLVSSSEKQVRPGRLQFGAVRTAYANLQFVCSVDHALWADPWCTMSPGPGRRAARRSEMQIMFAVREGSRCRGCAQGGVWWKRVGGRAGARQGRTAQNSRRMFVFAATLVPRRRDIRHENVRERGTPGKLEVQRAPWSDFLKRGRLSPSVVRCGAPLGRAETS